MPYISKTFSSKIDSDMKQKYLKKLRSEAFDINEIERSVRSKMEPPEAPLENLSKIMASTRFNAESTQIQKLFVETYETAQGMESKIKVYKEEIIRLNQFNKYLTLTQKYKEQLLKNVLEENRRLQEESKKCHKLEMNQRRKQTDPYFCGTPAKMTKSDVLSRDIDPSMDYQIMLDFFSERQKTDNDCQTYNEIGVLSSGKTGYENRLQESKSSTSKYRRGVNYNLSIMTVFFFP